MHNDIHVLRHILHSAKTIAVVGLSAQWNRPSYFAAKYMQEHGYKIIPVNPRYAGGGQTPAEKIMGEICYASLLDIPHPVDIVDVFRRSEEVVPIAHEALQMGASCLWQQLGVENLEAAQVFLSAGRHAVTNRCVKIEHARIFGGLHWAGVNTGVISAKRSR
jgi:uncharacterized protein